MRRVFFTMILVCLAAGPSSSAPGECTVPADCAVLGARCEGQRCTIATRQLLFPGTPGLAEIPLVQPPGLAATTATPELRWTPPIGADLVAVAIMKEPPAYDSRPDRIESFDDVVWIWHSGLPGGGPERSTLRFEEGYAFRRDAAVPAGDDWMWDPQPLSPGAYYWGVWAWKGLTLSYRSELRSFVVGREDLTGLGDCDACVGTSTARCLQSAPVYCVIACASDVDCYQGMSCDLGNLTPRHPWGICRSPLDGDCECGDRLCDPELRLCYSEFEIYRGERAAGTSGCSAGGAAVAPTALLLAGIGLIRRRSRSLRM